MVGPLKGTFDANSFNLSGDSINVEYSNFGFVGPQLVYRDDQTDRTFRGGEFTVEETRLGALITAIIRQVPDLEVVSFTLVLPPIRLTEPNTPIDITVPGITVTERTTIAGPQPGQQTFYSLVTLTGTASSIGG